MHGAALLFAASVAAKLAALATLYVTGAVLTKTDFALYAIAVAWGEMFGFLQNGGLHLLLLQRARSFDKLYAPVLGMAFAINGFWCLILLAMSPLIADFYDAQTLVLLVILFALSIPAGTMPPLLRSYMQVNLRFAEISALNVYAALVRNGGVILLALTGFGPVSFIIPVIAVGLFESVYLARRRPDSWRMAFPRRNLFRALTKPCLWIMVSMIAAALVTNGDYLVIGILEDKEIVGVYFFGFQLILAVLIMFTHALRAIFLPSFVVLGMDRRRQEEAFLRSLAMGSLLLFFVVLGMATVADPVVGWIWSGKWDVAVPVIEIIAVACLARVVSPIARSLLEARGAWRTVAGLSWLEGLGLVSSAAIGAYLGGLLEIALSVGAYMILFGLFYLGVIQRHTAFSLAAVANAALVPYLFAVAALAGAWTIAAVLPPMPGVLPEILIKGGSYTLIFAVLVVLFRRQMMLSIVDVIRQRLAR